jgi:hypothetical protein
MGQAGGGFPTWWRQLHYGSEDELDNAQIAGPMLQQMTPPTVEARRHQPDRPVRIPECQARSSPARRGSAGRHFGSDEVARTSTAMYLASMLNGSGPPTPVAPISPAGCG